MIQKFGLSRDPASYRYLCQNNNKTQLPQKVTATVASKLHFRNLIS
jgi:hypothetical protein